MAARKKKALWIYVGGDMERDDEELFKNPSLAAARQPENILYLKSMEELHSLISQKGLSLLVSFIDDTGRDSIIAKMPKIKNEVAARNLSRLRESVSRLTHNRAVCVDTDFGEIGIRLFSRASATAKAV